MRSVQRQNAVEWIGKGLGVLSTEEEQKAEKRQRLAKNLEKARAAKKEQSNTFIWKMVEARIQSTNCKCGLTPGMKLEDLMPPNMPGSGCQDKWVCQALDSYRRMLGH